MKCPSCEFENPADAIFCNKCGQKIDIACSKCGKINPPDSIFCNKCGQPLEETTQKESAPLSINIIDPELTSFADNRYQIKDVLGEGGKKKVYRAYDTLLDRDIALALIKTEGLDEDAKARITREAQAMGRVGTHENIVMIFDLGDIDGQPFIVSEILGGGDVEELIQKTPNHKLSQGQVIDIAQSICNGLQYAHDKGIVHRDLKPSNVYLTDSGRVKIGDFGLAIVDDRTRLTMEGMMVGTVSYMAPEQATGGEITPQSDLYALGAMLYEMVTGRPPFLGDDNVAIIGQHINTPPISPSWHNPDITASLEALIMKLLEKNAHDRPTSASDVIKSLELIKRGATEKEAIIPPEDTDKRSPVYRQVFVGRENELKQLKTAFDSSLSGQGSLVMVVGEPGIGKTAITQQLATYVTMRGGLTLVGHCYEEGSLSLPYLAFVEAMRTYVLNRDELDLFREMGSGASEVARIVSEVRDKLNVEPRPATNPDEDRYRLFQAVTDFLSNAANVQPLLIVLEDLHDADKGTLDLLVYIARRQSKSRILIVGTYRDVEVDRTHPLASILAELRRVSTYQRVLLRGLTIDEVQRMLSGLSGQAIQWQMAEGVHRQTEGNPLFIQEVVRYLVEDGLIVRQSGEWRAVDPDRLLMSIPEGLRDVIGKRLSNLSEKCGQVLSIAAVMGREFRFEVLQRLSDMADNDLYEALKEAAAAAVIEERTQAAGAVMYRFTHAFMRQALYEEMIAPRRNSLHVAIAKTLEEIFAARLSEHAVELSDHFSHSTNPEDLAKAVHYGEMAAERATAVFDYGEAIRLLEQSIQVQDVLDPEDKGKKCDLLISLCEALRLVGFPRRVLDKEALSALALAEEIEDRKRIADICRLAMNALAFYGAGPGLASPEMEKWAHKIDQYAEPGTIERAMADCELGIVEFSSRDPKRQINGVKLLDQSLELSRRLGEQEIYKSIATFWLFYVTAPQHEKKRLSLAEGFFNNIKKPLDINDYRLMYFVYNVCLEIGNCERYEIIAAQMNDLAEKSGQPNAVIISLFFKAIYANINGTLEEAVNIAQRIIDIGGESEFDLYAHTHYLVSMLRPKIHLGEAKTIINEDSVEAAPNISSKAWLMSLLERNIEANELLDEVIQTHIDVPLHEDEMMVYSDILNLETALTTGHKKMAERVLQRFENSGLKTSGIYYTTIIPRHLGAGAAMLGRYDEAKAHYLKAIKIAEEMRFRPELALSRFQLAELLFDHYPDEKEETLEHLNFAIDEFKEMKMQPSLEKAQALKDRF